MLSRQVIALAAALDPVAAPHLRLETNGPVLPLGDFHGRLAAAVIAALDDDMVADPVDLTPIKVLFALFYQPANASERERVARLCGQAVRHFNGNRPLQRREGGNGYYIDEPPPHRGGGSHGNRYRLFCAIWALERLCFAFYAQTSLMHEGEGDRSLDSCIRKQPPGFQLFMRVVQALDSFIAPRRPRQPFRPIEMPGFEDMILDAGAEGLPITILGEQGELAQLLNNGSPPPPLNRFLSPPTTNLSDSYYRDAVPRYRRAFVPAALRSLLRQ